MENNINSLLEKYWNAESTLEEEQQIKAYFEQNPDLEATAESSFFELLNNEQKIESKMTEADFLAAIAAEEKPAKVFSLKPLLKYAAILMLPVALFFSMQFFSLNDNGMTAATNEEQVIEDPEEAYQIAMQALAFAGSKINKGQEELAKSIPLLQKTNIYK